MATKQTSAFVCGNYGYRTNQIDGQTIKTRVLREAFAEALGDQNVIELDNSRILTCPLQFLLKARCGIKNCSLSVILPGPYGLQLFLPLFLHWKQKWNRHLQYVVIGGWLPQLLSKKYWLRHLCAQLDGIYVETPAMAENLRCLELSNVEILPNCRKFDRHVKRTYAATTVPMKLVFYSRVLREKGIEEAVAAVKRLNAEDVTHPRVLLDVYGPVADHYKREFRRCLSESQHVNYHGVLSPDNAYEVLHAYDLMLFPTYYEGEGFSGAVLDAYIAGVPVVASDWKYNREIVDEGRTGVLCRARSVEDIVTQVETFIVNPARVMEMRWHCLEKAQSYHVEQMVQRLLQDASARM